MRITNYNSVDHDIYTFNESGMVLVSVLPPTVTENLNNRVKAPITGYNTEGLWNRSLGGLTVPDWSGLHARDRGSNSYGNPNDCYSPPDALIGYYDDTYPYPFILNPHNWNNRVPPLYLISPKHFLACTHFTGPNTATAGIRLLGKDGVYVYRTGNKVATFGDLTLYQFEDQLTAPELVQVQPYQIVDPLTVPVNTAFWRQTPNGSFTAYQNAVASNIDDTGAIIYPHKSLVSYNSVNPDFPLDGIYWNGDSGSPLLVTKNGQTYLYGAFYLSGPPDIHFGDDVTWAWLAPYLAEAGVTSRANLGLDRYRIGIEVATDSRTYAAGFLEESESNGMSFTGLATGAAPLVYAKLVGPAAVIKNARISYIQAAPDSGLVNRFKCEVVTDAGLIFTRSNFNTQYAAELTSNANYVTGFITNPAFDCFFTYVFRETLTINTAPVEAGGPEYWLAPTALEPLVGLTTLVAGATPLNVNQNNAKAVVEFKAGTNYVIGSTLGTNAPATLSLGVVAGAGLGLVTCNDPAPAALTLTTINGVKPDDKGAISLAPEDAGCISLDAKQKQHEIKLDSHCAPCCRCADYEATQRFIKAYGIIYARLAKEYIRIANTYNSVAMQFANELACCATHDSVNPRFRTWPQQNFKLQIQALAENNKKVNVCLCSASLRVSVVNTEYMTATETITSLDGSTTTVQHTLAANTALMIAVLKEGAYVYFKGVNPGAQVTSTLGETGHLTVTADVLTLPIPTACSGPAALPTNCMEPCTGYIMLTAGLIIVDPTFRKIVNLNNEAYPITTGLYFSYEGTENCDLCSLNVIANTTRTISIAPNKKSVNPCAPVKAQSITKTPAPNPDDPDVYSITFPETVHVGTAGADLELNLKVFDAAAEQYESCGTLTLGLYPGTSGTEFTILGPSTEGTSGFAIPPNVTDPRGFIYTASYGTTGGGLTSRCLPNPDSFESVDIPVSPFSVGIGVAL